MKKSRFCSFLLITIAINGTLFGADKKPPKDPPYVFSQASAARAEQIDSEIRSGVGPQVSQAIADMQKWFSEDPTAATHGYWINRASFLVDRKRMTKEFAESFLAMLDVAIKQQSQVVVKEQRTGGLYVHQAVCLMSLDKLPDAYASFEKGLSVDKRYTASEAVGPLIKMMSWKKDYDDMMNVLVKSAAAWPGDPNTVEKALKECVGMQHFLHKDAEAVAYAKSLFNVSTMEHTSDALTLLDKEIGFNNPNDPSISEKFRQEESAGANPPKDGEGAHTSTVFAGIKVNAGAYDAALAEAANEADDETFDEMIRHTALQLIADKATDAMTTAKRAFAKAKKPKDVATATEMIARCLKAQDGTIGRANAWITNNQDASADLTTAPK